MLPLTRLKPGRKVLGLSAVLLPFTSAGDIDWPGFQRHLLRTAEAGLVPAVNMDTGYVNLITEAERREALSLTKKLLGGQQFVAGAWVGDQPGAEFDREAYARQIETIEIHGGTPVIFQSFGLTQGASEKNASERIVARYAEIARVCNRFIGFELGTMFAPFGAIYDLETYAGLMSIQQCLGAKHSSLSRELEWQRLELRDVHRPEFHVFTGNDLAIDMVMYGSDYLLGLSSFAPDLFARRDGFWEKGDPRFFELNDLLQYLGFFAFRAPVPAYKHSAAQFLKLRGWIDSDAPHPKGQRRPDSDVAVLQEIVQRLKT